MDQYSKQNSVDLRLLITTITIIHLLCVSQVEAKDNNVNFQGFSGLFNVPSGESLNYGEFHFSYSNLTDSLDGRFGAEGTAYADGNVFSLSTSPFPGLEVTMRNIGNDIQESSDLSANLKYSPTFIPKEWFSLAFGVQDLGGATNDLDAKFVSVSKEFQDFRLTIGTGKQEEKFENKVASRYTGGFYGLEYQPLDWLTLMAEHDGESNTVGARISTPLSWLQYKYQLSATILGKNQYDSEDHDALYFGLGLRTSLFTSEESRLNKKRQKEGRLAEALDWLFHDEDIERYQALDIGFSEHQHIDDKIVSKLGTIKHSISKLGFERVWIGLDGATLFVRFENSVFNRNEIDAIGVVLGLIAERVDEAIEHIDLTLLKYDVPTLRFHVSKQNLIDFYRGTTADILLTPRVANNQKLGDMFWVGGSRNPYWVPRFSFAPLLRSFVGTELGVFDYSFALRTSVTVPIWKGGEIIADYDLKLSDSDDFKRGTTFYRWRHDSGTKNILMRQTLQLPFNIYASAALGRVKEMQFEEHNIVALESSWQSTAGTHSFSFHGAYLDNVDFKSLDKDIFVGKYRYYSQALDMSLSAEAGKFWRQDDGVRITASFNFGDTKIDVFAQDTDVQSIGFSASIPLTPRRDMKPSFLQLKGVNSWQYGLTTRTDVVGSNPLAPQRAYLPSYLQHLQKTYFNNDRLSVAYIIANKDRLKNAYITYSR